mmetsp:Transcript_13826/g.34000  ORF Transcript_13826/g.34000 Transcript_13826/m.34000 type:complete len:204 (+) Transcript_13826:1567-2178(+)
MMRRHGAVTGVCHGAPSCHQRSRQRQARQRGRQQRLQRALHLHQRGAHAQLLRQPVAQHRQTPVNLGAQPHHGGVRVQQPVRHVDAQLGVARLADVAGQEAQQRLQPRRVAPAQRLPQRGPRRQLLQHRRHHVGPPRGQRRAQRVTVPELLEQPVVLLQLRLAPCSHHVVGGRRALALAADEVAEVGCREARLVALSPLRPHP